jgi:23S rRNA pseudouridine1911/1915/1917 synthase
MEDEDEPAFRRIVVNAGGHGMRLDRFLSARFAGRSRAWMAKGIREGRVTDEAGRALRASAPVREGTALRLYLEGIAPSGPPPAFPPVVYEDDRVVIVDKPSGMLAHPVGTDFSWGVVSLAKTRWPDRKPDLVHRIDRDTSGLLALTFDAAANGFLKARLHDEGTAKEYVALCKGTAPWESATLDGPLGLAGGEIRIQMAVRPDGVTARTDVTVIGRHADPPLTLVRCRIFSGRTHQIRVHLSHAGLPLIGDRLYGVPPSVFLGFQHDGPTEEGIAAAGAPRQALHAEHLVIPHPAGGMIDVTAPLPPDIAGWWADPSTLPWRR